MMNLDELQEVAKKYEVCENDLVAILYNTLYLHSDEMFEKETKEKYENFILEVYRRNHRKEELW